MRELTQHIIDPNLDTLQITVEDEPSEHGPNHRYEITGFNTGTNPSVENAQGYSHVKSRDVVLFQQGPRGENGSNGITDAALLAILIDRFAGFQEGPHACRENAMVKTKLEEAQMWLQKRARERNARNVLGTNEK